MPILPVHDVFFDDKATLAMGAAFDRACRSLRQFARAGQVRELIAKRIIEAAKYGELDPIRLHSHALMGFSIDDVSVPVVRVARDLPVPVYALIACTA
jgi:hypothetical protein